MGRWKHTEGERPNRVTVLERKPGGVLYEVATIPPGFTVDEDLSSLGSDLKLPHWEEPNRPLIEQGLATVTY